MGARDLLTDLAGAGLSVRADGDRLVIRPASKLTDAMRAALRDAKPELLALLGKGGRPPTKAKPGPWRLSPEQGERCHAGGWSDAEMAAFEARHARLLRWGYSTADADDLAERLTLRNRDGDERVSCNECQHYRPGRCNEHRRAGLLTPHVGRDLATMLQRCDQFHPQAATSGNGEGG